MNVFKSNQCAYFQKRVILISKTDPLHVLGFTDDPTMYLASPLTPPNWVIVILFSAQKESRAAHYMTPE